VASFPDNAFRLFDMHGNVWEWVQDCVNDSYVGAPGDGRAWETGDCEKRILRGGSWIYGAEEMRSGAEEMRSYVIPIPGIDIIITDDDEFRIHELA
jgi:formylglycine-generating enzyme required for sulfatase activity